jgi:hypothetical protein
VWSRVRGRRRDDGRDGEPWMLAFGAAGSGAGDAAFAPEAQERPEIHDPGRARVLVGRDVGDHDGGAPDPEGFLDDTDLPVPGAAEPFDGNRALVEALHRVAESFERVADSLDADRVARHETLDDVHGLLRTLVGELRSPAAVAPVVVAGTIDATDAARPLASGDDTIDLAALDPDRRPFERARRS